MLKIFSKSTSASEDLTDEALLANYLRTGEARFLGELYGRYLFMVYGLCVKILRDTGKAEDAVTAIYEELTHKVQAHKVESFRGWLYVLSRNYCLMEKRKTQRHPTDLHAPEDMYRFDAVEEAFDVEFPETASTLEKCLEELPENQKQCVQLFYYEDKTYKEIAELTAEAVGKIRSYIQNGRRNLKNCMDKFNTNN